MHLLRLNRQDAVSLTKDLSDNIPPYAILSHTWGSDQDEVTFADLEAQQGQSKTGYEKIRFCGRQARKDGLEYFWVDTCCINKNNHVELSEAITSMFRWYHEAVKCYVYLSDVSTGQDDECDLAPSRWKAAFRTSRWFTRGWTLQELLAPTTVEFFSREAKFLGDKRTLVQQIHQITKIPTTAILGKPLTHFSTDERMRWTEGRNTKKVEDRAYCLLGIFNVFMPLIYGEKDNAFARLQEQIAKLTAPPVQHTLTNTHWIVPRHPNPLFTGREDLLRELEVTIREAVNSPMNRDQCRIVISGIGGQGKSEICLQLTRRLRQMFWLVLWVDISTKDMAERAFLDAAQKLSIPAQDREDACLGIANLKHPWLLVLDNADDLDTDYQDYFPESNIGVVIMTTRNDECREFGTDRAIALEGLDEIEARELLLKAARLPIDQHAVHEQDAAKVASLLWSHPLALNQAGAYVSRGQCTLAEYPHLYAQQRRRLLTYRPRQAQSRYCDVYATFEVSAEMLKTSNTEAGHDALQLLSLLAMCEASQFSLSIFEFAWQGAKQIPADMDRYAEDKEVRLLTPWHVIHLPSVCQTDSETWNSFRLMEAVALLKAYSLITIDPHEGLKYISTHSLIHAWARDRQDDETQKQTWLLVGCVMALADRSERLWMRSNRWLLPHIQALIERDFICHFAVKEQKLIARILSRCGRFLLRLRANEDLSVLLDRVFIHLGLDRVNLDPSWIGLYNLKGNNFVDCGKLEEAIPILEEIVKYRKQWLSEEDADLLSSIHNLVRAYDFGRRRESITIFEKVVNIEERVLDEYHPDRLASQHELAVCLWECGQREAGIAIMRRVVEIRSQYLDKNHPDRLTSENRLAIYLWESGQREAGLVILAKVVETRRQCLDEDDPNRLNSEYTLATYLWESGQREAGIATMRRVVEIERQSLEEGKPTSSPELSESWLSYMEEEMQSSELFDEDHSVASEMVPDGVSMHRS